MIKKSPYIILGLEDNFEFKDIKKAYRKLIREFSPENHPKKFAEISDAYDILTDEEYFWNGTITNLYYIDIQLDIESNKDIDNSRHLKNIFEVPFNI